jgi:hypothetical protein
MLTTKHIVRKVSTLFGSKETESEQDSFINDKHIISTEVTSTVEVEDRSVTTELYFCYTNDAFLKGSHGVETENRGIHTEPYTTSGDLYNGIIDSVTLTVSHEWVLSEYSHCVRILQKSTGVYRLCIVKEGCQECNVYDSLVTAMMFALLSMKGHAIP